MDIFSARDLRNRSGELLGDASMGKLSLITKHGKPVILAVPFNDQLIELGLHKSLALNLFETGTLTLAQAAKLSDMTLETFMVLVGDMGIAAVDYAAKELEDELRHAR